MTIRTKLLCYPDGETQETEIPLRINQVVDLNGNPLPTPLLTVRMIAYRVYKISTHESVGEETTCYHLELLRRSDMMEYL